MKSIAYYLVQLIYLYQMILIIYVISTWLINLNILNTNNRFVYSFINILHKICDPTLSIVKKYIPTFANIDFSPIIVFIILEIFKQIVII